VVFTGPGQLEFRDEPAPVVGDDEALVTVRASGICGSELHGFRSVGMRVPPLIMGHEFVGTTTDGRRVAVNPLLFCGTCERCAEGRPQVCRTRRLLGVHQPGGFAEQVAVPRRALQTLPDDLPDEAAALVEPLANAVHAWSLLPADARRVHVIGAGAIGLVCGLVAARNGADVQISDRSEQRLATARRLGLTAVAAPSAPDYDAVIDAVGLPATRRASVERTRTAGTAVWIGLADDTAEFSGNDLVRGEKTVTGSFAYAPDEFAQAVELAPTLDLSWATAVPLDRAVDVFYSLAEGRTDIVKAVIMPGAR
jgi:threonine dehydrogenase-like Zn-dependent dehydrogenase